MFIIKLLEEFSTEEKCEDHFRQTREKEGIICKKCKHMVHYWLSGKKQWQCKQCKFRTTLKSGTIMEQSKITFRKWYRVMIMMSSTKKGISAKEMQRQFEANRYESIWNLMHKIRIAMGNRDGIYKLGDQVEMDEGYFRVETTEQKKAGQRRGRGSVTTMPVSIIVESTRLEDIDTATKSTHCGHLKMRVIENHKAETIDEVVTGNIETESVLFTDESTSYAHVKDLVESHQSFKSSEETTKTELNWVHTAISNSKRVLNGIHHKINEKYIQGYLNEFCYKFNRRYFGKELFARVVIAVAIMIQ